MACGKNWNTAYPQKSKGSSKNKSANFCMSEVLMPIDTDGSREAGTSSDLTQVLLQVDQRFFQLVLNHRDLQSGDDITEKLKKGLSLNIFSLDIKELVNFYCHAVFGVSGIEEVPQLDELSKQSSSMDLHTARDLVQKMATKEGFSLEDVLMHPFHWSAKEKIDFICQAFEIINMECNFKNEPKLRKKTQLDAENYDLVKDQGKVFSVGEGWLHQLKLSKEEVKRLKHRASKEIICDSALNTKGETSYDTSSLLSLMRFFRNYHIHYWEKNIQVREAFGNAYEGYWKFFYRRFPRLFMFVYDRMKEFVLPSANFVPRVNMRKINLGGVK